MPGTQKRDKTWKWNGVTPAMSTGYINQDVLLKRLIQLFPQVASAEEFDLKHPDEDSSAGWVFYAPDIVPKQEYLELARKSRHR